MGTTLARSGWWGGDIPRVPPTMTGWGTPHHDWMGYPPITSIASTCYVAGGMPLAFTQEDFLVPYCLGPVPYSCLCSASAQCEYAIAVHFQRVKANMKERSKFNLCHLKSITLTPRISRSSHISSQQSSRKHKQLSSLTKISTVTIKRLPTLSSATDRSCFMSGSGVMDRSRAAVVYPWGVGGRVNRPCSALSTPCICCKPSLSITCASK